MKMNFNFILEKLLTDVSIHKYKDIKKFFFRYIFLKEKEQSASKLSFDYKIRYLVYLVLPFLLLIPKTISNKREDSFINPIKIKMKFCIELFPIEI